MMLSSSRCAPIAPTCAWCSGISVEVWNGGAATLNILSSSIDRTLALHRELGRRWRMKPASVERACRLAQQALAGRGVRSATGEAVPFILSAFLLRPAEELALASLAENIHGLVERALDWTLEDPDRLHRYFSDHQRMFPYLRKSPGLDHWQGYSRYDAVLTADGGLQVIELNTGCPGAFQNAPQIHEVVADSLRELLGPGMAIGESAGPPAESLSNFLLEVEARADCGNGLIAVLTDENDLRYELPLMVNALERAGRRSVLTSAQALEQGATGGLVWQGAPISATFNKFRISTAGSPNHCWSAGFENRYRPLLAAMAAGDIVSVNNLCALSVAEDKGLMALLHTDELGVELSDTQRQLVAQSISWTSRLEDVRAGKGPRQGDEVPRAHLAEHRHGYLWKPANEGRGFEVHLGKISDVSTWDRLCSPNPTLPGVLQEYIEPLRLPVILSRGDRVELQEHFVVVSMAVIDGRYRGFHMRTSAEPVVNGARAGTTGAVLRSP